MTVGVCVFGLSMGMRMTLKLWIFFPCVVVPGRFQPVLRNPAAIPLMLM